MKLFLTLLNIIFVLTAFCQTDRYNPNHFFSIEELQSDLKFYKLNLQKQHPNLYLYTTKAKFKLFFDSLSISITKPMAALEFYNRITLVNSKIKDGHTMILPSEESTNYFAKNASFFPFYLIILDKKGYINMNCSADTSLKDGAEILSINGMKTNDILQELIKRQIHDGENSTYPIWILNNYFKEYFSFSFGHPKVFSIEYKNKIANVEIKNIDALSKDSIKFYKQNKYSNRNPINEQGINVEIKKDVKTAILSIKSFDIEILKSQYHQDFKVEIENAFKKIRNNQCTNLILDLRNNQGGDFEPGRILLSFLLDKPVEFLKGSKEYQAIELLKNRYKNKLYVLINGGSFSITGIVCSYLESTKRAIFIGEETGGNKTNISGESIEIYFPNTKLLCQISTTNFLIQYKKNDGHGIMPKYAVKQNIDDLIMNKDTEKEFVLKLINKNIKQ